jgi:hypothetical protein
VPFTVRTAVIEVSRPSLSYPIVSTTPPGMVTDTGRPCVNAKVSVALFVVWVIPEIWLA